MILSESSQTVLHPVHLCLIKKTSLSWSVGLIIYNLLITFYMQTPKNGLFWITEVVCLSREMKCLCGERKSEELCLLPVRRPQGSYKWVPHWHKMIPLETSWTMQETRLGLKALYLPPQYVKRTLPGTSQGQTMSHSCWFLPKRRKGWIMMDCQARHECKLFNAKRGWKILYSIPSPDLCEIRARHYPHWSDWNKMSGNFPSASSV